MELVPKYPLILAISGRPGDGKSFQTSFVLREAGYNAVVASASALQGSFEGDAVKAFEDLYSRALAIKSAGSRAAIVIEDFDTSIASTRAGISYGVNSQLLVSHLMHLSENISNEPKDASRCAVFITGNDFSSIYSPLLRPGRMNFFEWLPTHEELESMVAGLLAEYGDFPSAFSKKIASSFDGLSIATVKAAVHESIADQLLEGIGSSKLSTMQGCAVNLRVDEQSIFEAIGRHHSSYRASVLKDRNGAGSTKS